MENRVKGVMASVLGLDISEINYNTSTDTVEKWDSLKSINLVMALEEEFGVKFDEEDIMNMLNYKIICLIVKEKLDKIRNKW